MWEDGGGGGEGRVVERRGGRRWNGGRERGRECVIERVQEVGGEDEED